MSTTTTGLAVLLPHCSQYSLGMPSLSRDGVDLAYSDTAPGDVQRPSLVLLHGWCGNRSALAAQATAFQSSHRVISVDLRGFGDSSAPEQDYTMAVFADDVAWMCEQLEVTKPVVVGHSMGGNVALELAARHPHLPQQVVLIDSVVFPPEQLSTSFDALLAGVSSPDYVAVCNGLLKSLCLPSDAFAQRLAPDASLHAPQHVVLSSLRHHTADSRSVEAAKLCQLPIAYIAANDPLADLVQFRAATPQLQVGRVVGSGHFSPQEVPEQVNAMIERLIEVHKS